MSRKNQVIPSASRVDRRKRLLLTSAPLLALSPFGFAQTAPPIALEKLHSFGLRVSNLDESLRFYQQLFGAAIQARQGDTVCLQIGSGPQFFSLRATQAGESPGFTHIGLGVRNFDIDTVQSQLRGFGVDPSEEFITVGADMDYAARSWRRTRYADAGGDSSGTQELFFKDIDGLSYQLGPLDHCGGQGGLGDQCGNVEPSPYRGIFQLTELSHFTNFISNRDRANNFHTRAFGKQFQAYQGENFPIIGVGDGLQFLMYIGGTDIALPEQAGRIDHVCFNMRDFSVEGIRGKLTEFGLNPRLDPDDTQAMMHWVSMRMPNRGGAKGGTPEVYFSDLDGIRIQLQDGGYCGGGGYLGDSCPAL